MSSYEEYIEKYKKLHSGEMSFRFQPSGELMPVTQINHEFSGREFLKRFVKPLEQYLDGINSSVTLLDYGCGKGKVGWMSFDKYTNGLWGHFGKKIRAMWLYDPAIPEFSKKPPRGLVFDVVGCADVLEHVPEEFVDDVLKEINSYTHETGFVMLGISGILSSKTFEDGENLHITRKSNDWWFEKIKKNINKQFVLVHNSEDGTYSTLFCMRKKPVS